LDEKIKKKEKNTKENNEYWKKIEINWRKYDISVPKNIIKTFNKPIIMEIDKFFLFNDIISNRKKKILLNYEIFSNDFCSYLPVEEMDIYDESKLNEICNYNEKVYFKNNPPNDYNFNLNKMQPLNLQQAKDIIFYYNKLIELMKYKKDDSINIYRIKLKDFLEITCFKENEIK
jgi:hypothetical protein